VHFDTVSRQLFENIQETQFSGSKIQDHVHLENAFPGGIGNQRIRFAYNLWFASHPSPRGVSYLAGSLTNQQKERKKRKKHLV